MEDERELLHRRSFEFQGYRRPDGHFDIEGRMTDRKAYDFPNDWRGTIAAGDALHDMRIRVTIDEEFRILDIEAQTADAPFAICGAITPAFAALKGERMGKGWTRLLRQKFGGVHGCTHHVELLRTMATVAFQTVYGEKMRRQRQQGAVAPGEAGDGKRPSFIDTCHALAADGEIVRASWPEFYETKR
jgi:hypothetical protein